MAYTVIYSLISIFLRYIYCHIKMMETVDSRLAIILNTLCHL